MSEFDEVELPDLSFPVPPGSGWFGYTSLPESVERYGITLDEYQRMHADQEGHCAICQRHETAVGPLVVDHDHDSKRVRGLLCQNCNRGLGQFKDDPHLLEWARRYIVERGCAATRPLTVEEEKSMAPFVESPQQRARRLAESRRRYRLLLLYRDGRTEETTFESEQPLVREGATFIYRNILWRVNSHDISDGDAPRQRLTCDELRSARPADRQR